VKSVENGSSVNPAGARENTVRLLFLADTHLGFDLPSRPRVDRRRRGHDFFLNYERALSVARSKKVDMVIHGGDVFIRSKVSPALVEMSFAPLNHIADLGIPVFIVPGNHERARIPLNLWNSHPNIHIFEKPRTFLREINGISVSISGFPFVRKIRDAFKRNMVSTGFHNFTVDHRLLCFHQAVEGAQVGVSDYTFRSGPDVIAGRDIPDCFSAVLSGHIHRAQTLTSDLRGNLLGTPVIYPGSIERTSFTERLEEKGYVLIELGKNGREKGRDMAYSFRQLPTRKMVNLVLEDTDLREVSHLERVRTKLNSLDPEAVVRIALNGGSIKDRNITSQQLRMLAPPTMNVYLGVAG